MKIAIISPFQFRLRRGIERVNWSLSQALAERGVKVDMLAWDWPKPVQWGEAPKALAVKKMPHFRYFMAQFAALYYLCWLANGRYDWAMIAFAAYGEAAALNMLRPLRRQRYCIVFHYPGSLVPHRYAEFKRSRLAERAAALVAVSDYVADSVRDYFGRPSHVIGNGVDTAIFLPNAAARERIRREMNISPDAPILITLAALEERKGVQYVIRAMPALLRDFPGAQYWVLGEGPHRAALQGEIGRLGLENSVKLLGSREDVADYLAAADVGCLLSYGESFGMALIEYMAMGLPALASTEPPFDELIRPEWGLMVDTRDSTAVIEALRGLLRSPERRATMGRAGREQVTRAHSWARIADEYLRLFSSSL